MVEKSYKSPDGVHEPFSSCAHCVEVANPSKFLFCSGQVPATPDGKLLGADDFTAQGEQVIEKYIRNTTPSIRKDGFDKVLLGKTTLEEVLRVTREE